VAAGMNVCPAIGQNREDIMQYGYPAIGNTVAVDIDGYLATGIINTVDFFKPFDLIKNKQPDLNARLFACVLIDYLVFF
jgi:hypothetical protein